MGPPVDRRRASPQGRRALSTWLWLGAGLASVAIGGIGIVVPGLPTTVFFILAAGCFARSSPRLERWVLELPRIGPLVRDYRAGLGMPRRAKVVAISFISLTSLASGIVAIDDRVLGGLVIIVGLVGASYVGLWVPTRERVLAERATTAS